MKLNNLTIAPKLGILVGVTLVGLCIAGVLAGYLMQRELLNARIDQTKAIVDMARNMAAGLQKEVQAGKLTKEAALAEFGRRANSMTYDNGSGYLFGTSYDGITLVAPEPKQVGTNRMDVVTNGRMLSRELMDGVKAHGEILLPYEYVKPGQEKTVGKISYAAAVPGFDMYLGTGAYLDDLDAKLMPIIWTLGVAVLIIAVVSSGIAWLIGRSIIGPLAGLTSGMKELAGGNFGVVLPGLDRKDEVGDMARAVETFKVKAEEKARDEAEAKIVQDQVAAKQHKADMVKLADDFEGAVGEIIETVSSASTELEASASTLTSTAVRSQELTTMVVAASEEASTNVQSVASATEELGSSVNEINRQVQGSARIANEAVDQARKTNDRVGELSKAAGRIGDVVELINTIAGQTNLLALNATIEAARAGEAGRGFAVVASEVKALAEQTAKATGEIGQHITGIQAATEESVNNIKEITGIIEKLSEISSTIAAAVKEQGAAMREISRNVQQAAQGTRQVSSNITHVQHGASETGSASSQVLSAARSLSSESNRLKVEVSRFLNSVRSA